MGHLEHGYKLVGATTYGEDMIFDEEDEARDWLNARGGMI